MEEVVEANLPHTEAGETSSATDLPATPPMTQEEEESRDLPADREDLQIQGSHPPMAYLIPLDGGKAKNWRLSVSEPSQRLSTLTPGCSPQN